MFGLRALGALPYTGRPETAVTGGIKWYLNVVSPPNGYMTLKTPLDNIDYGLAQYAIEFKITVSAGGVALLGVNGPALGTTNSIGFTSSGRFQIGAGGSTYLFTNTNTYILDGLPHIYRFEHDADGAWRFYRDGTLFQSGVKSTSVTPSAPIGALFAIGTTMTGANCQFYYLALEGFGVGSGVWDADKSGGVGNKLLSSSGNDATQAGTWSNSGWVPYLDTTVINSIVNQGVNGTANYFCTLNGTSYFTAPTLGNLLAGSPKIRINIKKFRQFGSSVEPIFWQGGNSWGTRELALRNNSSLGNIIIGGVATGFTWSDLTTAFGDPNLTCDEFGFEINGTNAIFYKNKVAIFTVPNLSKGTSRLDGALLFIGAQPSTDNAGATTAISIVPNGMQYGDIEILINDVLVRNYKMPDNGSTVVDTVGGNNLTQRGTFTIDNNEWRQYVVFNTVPQAPDKVITTMMTTKIRTSSPVLAMKVGINSQITFARASTVSTRLKSAIVSRMTNVRHSFTFSATKIAPLTIQTISRTKSTGVRSKVGISSGTTRARTKSTNAFYKIASGTLVTRGRTKTTSTARKVLVKLGQTLGRAKSTFNFQKSALVAALGKAKSKSTGTGLKLSQVQVSSAAVAFSVSQAKKSLTSHAFSTTFASAETAAMKGAIVVGMSAAKAFAEFTYFNPANAIPPKFININTVATTTWDLSTSAHLTTTIITLRKTTHDY